MVKAYDASNSGLPRYPLYQHEVCRLLIECITGKFPARPVLPVIPAAPVAPVPPVAPWSPTCPDHPVDPVSPVAQTTCIMSYDRPTGHNVRI